MKNKKLNRRIILHSLVLINALFYTGTTKSTGGATNTDGDQKQQVNFFGTLLTYQGQKDNVDNISIGGKYKDIIMYASPVNHSEEVLNTKTKEADIKLDENPSTAFVTKKINLCSVKEIHIPKPHTTWYYQKAEKLQRIEFTQVQIYFSDAPSVPELYLLDNKTHIYCNSIDKAGSQKTEVPLIAIDKLTIEGYGEKKDDSNSCPPAKNNNKTTTNQKQPPSTPVV